MYRGTWGVVAALAFTAGTAHAATYVSDPLTDPSFAGRGSKGGTFDASGWTTTSSPTDPSQDSVWYEIPDALPTGSVEFTVQGISIGGNLTGSDHDIIVLYAAPTGETEPIPYSPSFRNNDFKAFIRIFGSLEPTRPGATKLEVAACPRGDPWWHNDACPAGCDQSGIAYANGGNDPGWDPAVAYRIRIEWSPGLMSYYRDGNKLGDVPFAGTYAPQPLRVRIGSPRNDNVYPGEAFMPAGLTFRDVLVEGTPGSPTPVCNVVTTPDAGAAGATSSDAGGAATTASVLADVTGASWESGVFPDVTDLNVEANADTTPSAVVYLRFPSAGGAVDKALLRLHTQAYGSAAGGSGIVCRVDDDTWQETTLAWANRPTVSTQCAGAAQSVDADSEVEWDITSLVPATGHVNLAIVSQDGDGAHYMSKEAGDAAKAPRLVTWLSAAGGSGGSSGASATGGGAGWSDAGSSGGNGGSGATTGGGSNGGPSRGSTDAASGCGCHAPARSAGGAWPLVALLMAWAVRRRVA